MIWHFRFAEQPNEWMDGWIEWSDGWMNGWSDGLIDEWINKWMNERIDGWIVGLKPEWNDLVLITIKFIYLKK